MEEREPATFCRNTACRAAQCSSTRCCALVRRAGAEDEISAHEALSALCDASWRPVYGLIRAQGYGAADAEDLTQAYFARFLEKGCIQRVQSWQGCFRPFLRVSVRHFLSNERDRERAAKRGGGRPLVSLDAEDAALLAPVDPVTPEDLLERRRTQEAVQRALDRLREEMERAGQGARLARLKGRLVGDPESFGPIAREWGVGRSAVRVALHRLRRRLAVLLREEAYPGRSRAPAPVRAAGPDHSRGRGSIRVNDPIWSCSGGIDGFGGRRH
jgi:RNA polymerase sigma-70 factor (ECF subfamily)